MMRRRVEEAGGNIILGADKSMIGEYKFRGTHGLYVRFCGKRWGRSRWRMGEIYITEKCFFTILLDV